MLLRYMVYNCRLDLAFLREDDGLDYIKNENRDCFWLKIMRNN